MEKTPFGVESEALVPKGNYFGSCQDFLPDLPASP